MVGAEQAVEIDRPKLELAAIRDLESRNPWRLLVLVWLSRRELEEGIVHAENRSCDATGWESLQPKDSQALREIGLLRLRR
jgi:hypothetical protein